jgi:hypothetical protein
MTRYISAGILITVMALGLSAPIVSAQQPQQPKDEQEFFTWMEAVSQLNGKLGYYLKDKDSEESAKAAKQMQDAFTHIVAFFTARKVEDAAKFAQGALAGFKKTEELAAAGKMPEALQSYYDARENCEGCHQTHRVRNAAGDWQIKY